ncbi:hypothetical protein [uncultured Maricaulis sp.]|uniref:hypothetical protein n=1 Tax=uncultured Maricaulis sp. TaxID=174710 RepID=UPI0030D9E836|tara:strand:+ start:7758 stop:8132 length:375 start_codon:yes stop_codon:yes gene_type:complete
MKAKILEFLSVVGIATILQKSCFILITIAGYLNWAGVIWVLVIYAAVSVVVIELLFKGGRQAYALQFTVFGYVVFSHRVQSMLEQGGVAVSAPYWWGTGVASVLYLLALFAIFRRHRNGLEPYW